jgi:glycosyltransferase involved in cell wall biosynthesis
MRNQHPKVSIIVPCFNGESFLQETLDSIFAQTYKNYELILIDDGSTDSTPEIIRSLKNRVRFKLESINEGGGGGGARKKGLEMARGEYIQYVDQDDILFPDAIEKRLEALEANSGDIAYSDFQWLEESDDGIFKPTTIRNKKLEQVSPDIQLALFDRWWCPLVGLTYRRQIIEQIAWKKSFVDDARYIFDACLAGARFIHVPGVRAYYRIHKKGVSRHQASWYRGIFEYAFYVENIWKQENSLSEERLNAMASYYKKIVDYSRGKDPQLFNDAFQQLFFLKHQNKAIRMMANFMGYKNFDALITLRNKLRKKLLSVRGK